MSCFLQILACPQLKRRRLQGAGLSILYFFSTFLREVGGAEARPCIHFDLIAGTSTGVLIALLFRKLQYSIGERIEAYAYLGPKFEAFAQLGPRLFESKDAPAVCESGKAMYSSEELQRSLDENNAHGPMLNDSDPCRVSQSCP